MSKSRLTHSFAKKSLGQNFLIDNVVIGRIVDAADVAASDTIIEIGPGRGALTLRLMERAARVVAVEFDRDMVVFLRKEFRDDPRIEIYSADALKIDLSRLVPEADGPVKVVANLPYNVSTAILQRLFEVHDRFERCVLMFQREVVERITAAAGSSERGYLTVLTELFFDVERLFDVSPTAFRPAPKVWSSVVRLSPKNKPALDIAAFQKLVAAGFAQKRKTIANNLRLRYQDSAEILGAASIEPKRRAETLRIEEWLGLYEALSNKAEHTTRPIC